MMSGRSMYKTKLCVLYTKRGHCSRLNCSFAHGNAELRRPGSSFPGRRHNQDNDLRDKLDRQFSLERRHSSGRNSRSRQKFSGHDALRPFEKRRENQKLDEEGDYAGGSNVGNRIEDRAGNRRNKFSGYNHVLEEQLKGVELDIKELIDDKQRIGVFIKEKVQEAEILTSRIQELEIQLEREKEECRRITSSIKKFVKEHNRFSRAQDDLKRSQARLQKLGNQLCSYLTGSEGNDRDADIDIVSDEENAVHRSKTAWDTQTEMQNTSSLTRKRHYLGQIEEPDEDAELIGDGEEKLETVALKNPSRWILDPLKSSTEKVTIVTNGESLSTEPSAKEDKRKRRRFSSCTPTLDKAKAGSGSAVVMPSTSMAAHADDEVTEIEEEKLELVKIVAAETDGVSNNSEPGGSPFLAPPPPPPVSRNADSTQGEEEEDVDGGGTGEADNVEIV